MYEYIRNPYLEGFALLLFFLASSISSFIAFQMNKSYSYTTRILGFYSDQPVDLSDTPPPLIPLPTLSAEELYEQKNKTLYDKLENIPKEKLQLEDYKHKILLEYVPSVNGNIIMFYNHERNSFHYYSDRVLSYNLVNKFGRKYVIRFNCKALFLEEDAPIEPEPETEKTDKEKEASSEEAITNPAKTNPNVFAKLKSYNNMKVKLADNNISTQRASVNTPVKPKLANVNRYTYEGKLSNFSFLQKLQPIKKLSYKDFKRMNSVQ